MEDRLDVSVKFVKFFLILKQVRISSGHVNSDYQASSASVALLEIKHFSKFMVMSGVKNSLLLSATRFWLSKQRPKFEFVLKQAFGSKPDFHAKSRTK